MPHNYTYINDNVGTPAISGTTATIDSVFAFYDEAINAFRWDATYSADRLADLPTGFTLVVNDGPMPKTHLGSLAVLYFEAEEAIAGLTPGNQIANIGTGTAGGGLSAYAYNGGSSASAHRTSDYRDVQSVTPDAPDQIASSKNGSLDYFATILDSESNGRVIREMRVVISDLAPIRNHTPSQPSLDVMNNVPLTWTGIGFAEEIGIWFHPFNNINAEYIEGGPEDGFLKHGVVGATVNDGWQVNRDNYGFFDVDNLDSTLKDGQPIPEPASALLLLAGAVVFGRRQR